MASEDDRFLSPGSAGLMMLVWQQPTDRALAGWSPWSNWDPATEKSDSELMRWLASMMTAMPSERRRLE